MADLKILTALSASSGVAVSGSTGLIVQQGGVNVSAGGVTITGGDLRLNNNVIKSSGGSTAITLNSTDVKTEGDLIVGAGHIKVGTNTESIIMDASTGRADFQAGIRVTGSTVTSGSLTIGGNGDFQAGGGTFSSTLNAQALLVTNGVLNVTGGDISGSANLKVAGQVTGSALSIVNAASVGSLTTTNNLTVGGNIVADADENKSIFAAVATQTITVGAAGGTVSIPGTASVGGNLTVTGDLTVNGTTTTINTQNLVVEDHNIILGAVTSPTDITADGGGITLSGSTNKTFVWENDTDSWTSSEHLDLASGKSFRVDGLEILKVGSVLGGQVTNATVLTSGSNNAFAAIGNTQNGSSVVLSGSSILAAAPAIQVGPGLLGGGDPELFIQTDAASFSSTTTVTVGKDLSVQDTLTITTGSGGSRTFSYVTVTGGEINVAAALDQLDAAIASAAGGATVSPTEYYNVRSVLSGTKQASPDTVTFTLSETVGVGTPQGEGGATPTGVALTGMSASSAEGADILIQRLGGMSFDVATRDVTNQVWSNDLVSVQLTASLSSSVWYPQIIVNAPALTNGSQVRLIAVNETKNVIS